MVYCPECGAPHHRECYNSIGHCALEEFHGTDMQYDKLKRAQEAEAEKKAAEEKEAYTQGYTDSRIFCQITDDVHTVISFECLKCNKKTLTVRFVN